MDNEKVLEVAKKSSEALSKLKKKMDILCVSEIKLYTGLWVNYEGLLKNEFKRNETDVDFVIPNGVIAIDSNAFEKWFIARIRTLQLPDSLMTIGRDAFKGRDDMQVLRIPDSVYKIHRMAFEKTKFGQILFGEDSILAELAEDTFEECQMQSITLPKNYVTIDGRSFEKCKIAEVISKAEALKISKGAFKNSLIEKIVNDNVVIVENDAFWGCEYLKEIDLRNTRRIETGAFSYCVRLRDIELNKCETIKSEAFFGITINKLKMTMMNCKIEADAFDNCVIKLLACTKEMYNSMKHKDNCTIEKWVNIEDKSEWKFNGR